MKNFKGQSLYYFLVFVMILIISWSMMLNIAKLICARMIMQNKVDNIALSAAVHKARTMNFVGACNYLIGSVLALGTRPDIVQIPTLTTNQVASFMWRDYESGHREEALDDGAAMLKEIVDALKEAQDAAMVSHLAYQDALIAEHAVGDYKLALYPIKLPTKENAREYFGLKRNSKGITYLKTVNTEPTPYPNMVYNPFPMADITAKITDSSIAGIAKLFNALGIDIDDIIAKALGLSQEAFEPKVYERDEESWYIIDENFSQQKIQAILIKAPKDKNRPLFARLLDISFPPLTAFSAAAIYNTKGPMFPVEESDLIGKPDELLETLLMTSILAQTALYMGQLVSKDSTPYKILSVLQGVYITARVAERIIGAKKDPLTSPINAYNEAKLGGWTAHLVPYNSAK